ncbi:uncharacterized protein BXZ73DRAFT_104149 [Epithele typhae]|uniref:uncharacterized protein n=1 Tax=Epithele typhae TaxID=378194 RepID=UPI002007B9CA|nr:uncharacterized protein BXZ73DRAFT_104149 [Epithele typhae]KAH9922331.1 hypothetical protein BXZ73DRAFT_104149 [Epithele typhae]
MATAFAHSPPTPAQSSPFLSPGSPPQQLRRPISRQRFIQDFSQCLFEFVIQLLPTTEEMAVKEDVRKLLERLIRTIEPDSRLLSFGSSANGFSLKNSDMDLCCLIDAGERLNASDLVTMVGDLLERETKFHVKPLPHARIPIVKLNLDPSPALPFGIACDIGFENRLALENTRLLMCYASVDPARVRTMVLFLKVWSKRRKINSPYKGTLSSYGYVLLVIYFLVHVKNPPVLPNLQQMPPLRPIPDEESHLNGYNIWFFDDVELLRQRWQSSNADTVADLLIDFFKFYSRDFTYNMGVASIRAGLLKKDDKGWLSEDYGTGRERNRLCIEDPFETDFNVARCVTKDGLYTIRGEFMRASRILQTRPERAILALAQLCEERKEETLGPPPPPPQPRSTPSSSTFTSTRLTSIPPQTPYTVGSSPMRPNGVPVPAPEDIASLRKSDALSPTSPALSSPSDSPGRTAAVVPKDSTLRLPIDKLDHMAPIRSKWTSPPPPDAPEEDHSAFEDRLGQGIALATISTAPRLRERSYASSNASETHTDDERQSIAESDDVRSVKSYLEEGAVHYSREFRERERQLANLHAQQAALQQRLQQQYGIEPSSPGMSAAPANSRLEGGVDVKMISRLRGRPAARSGQPSNGPVPPTNGRSTPSDRSDDFTPPPRIDAHTPRRSMSFPVRNLNRFSLPAQGFPNPLAPAYHAHMSPTLSNVPPRYVLSNSAEAQAQAQAQAAIQAQTQSNVYYEAMPPRERMLRAMAAYSPQVHFTSPQPTYDPLSHMYATGSSMSTSQSRSASRSRSRSRSRSQERSPITIRRVSASGAAEEVIAGPSRLPADAPVSPHPDAAARMYSHQHSHSSTTITAPTPPAHVHHFSVALPPIAAIPPTSGATLGPRHSHEHSRSRSPPFLPGQRHPPHPYAFPQAYGGQSPRMGAANLPPRLRADRERSFGAVNGVPASPSPRARAAPLPPTTAAAHAHTHIPLPASSPASLRPASQHSHSSSGSASPPTSCASLSLSLGSQSQYAGSSSPLSTSPPSPAQSEAAKAGGGAERAMPLLDGLAPAFGLQRLEEEVQTPDKDAATPVPVSSASSPSAAVAVLPAKGGEVLDSAQVVPELPSLEVPAPTPAPASSQLAATPEVVVCSAKPAAGATQGAS